MVREEDASVSGNIDEEGDARDYEVEVGGVVPVAQAHAFGVRGCEGYIAIGRGGLRGGLAKLVEERLAVTSLVVMGNGIAKLFLRGTKDSDKD